MNTADRRHVAVRSLEHEIGTLLRRIRNGLAERAVQVHPELNPTSYMILTTLSEHGARRAADLAELFALDKGSVSRVVHQLLELGLIARTPDPADGRASLLSVTDEAVRRLAEVRDHRREHGALAGHGARHGPGHGRLHGAGAGEGRTGGHAIGSVQLRRGAA